MRISGTEPSSVILSKKNLNIVSMIETYTCNSLLTMFLVQAKVRLDLEGQNFLHINNLIH